MHRSRSRDGRVWRAVLIATTVVGCGDASTVPSVAADATLDAGAPGAFDATGAGPSDKGAHDASADSDSGDAEGGQAADADTGLGDARPPDASDEAGVGNCGAKFGGGTTPTTGIHRDIGVHDPSMIWDGSRYFLFATGGTLGIRSSTDLQTWTGAGSVFGVVPAWITTALGSTPPDLWAPDISYFAGQFHLYYAGSSFGSNNSVIGLATNATLAPGDAQYKWVDQGQVVRTTSPDDFNAIDPNVSFDVNCSPWLAFGSFWSGIKMRKLNPITGKTADDDKTLYSLASRNGGAIEAPSIVSHNGFFYLFVSFDTCCNGVNSTYKTMVGRASRITGPYTNKAGVDMMQGATEQLLVTSGRYIGPGGGTAWRDGDAFLYAFHYYDGLAGGAPKLQVRPITFGADDWVTLGPPLFP